MAKDTKKIKRKTKKINMDVYDTGYEEEIAEKLMRRRGGGGSQRNYDEFVEEENNFQTENIDQENDEEITEDDAFNDEDEEKYGVFFTKNERIEGKFTKERKISVYEDLDLASYSEDDEKDFVDLSQMLEKGDPSIAPPQKTEKMKFLIPESPEDPSEINIDTVPTDSDFTDNEADLDLSSIVDNLQSTKSKKRKRLEERTEAFQESEFMPISINTNMRKKMVLNDLVDVIQQENTFGELKRQLGALEKVETTSVPLAPRLQDKLDRIAAKEETDKSVSKWIPIVKKNREAETLSFPMNEPPVVNLSSGALVGKFEPFTELEKEINHVLESSGLTEKRQKELEELELNKLSREEIIQRRAELAKMRSLLFFKEQKQKKIAKIKSKTYRKIAKKAVEKKSEKLIIDQLDPERAKEERERLEYERAKERMTLKHKNTGKWAKRIIGRFESSSSETHKAIMEQLEKGDVLRQRINGSNSDSDDSNEVDDALNKLDALEEDIDTASSQTKKGVFGMKFMQRDIRNQESEVKYNILQAKREIMMIGNNLEGESSNENTAVSRHKFEKNVTNSVDEITISENYRNDNHREEFHVKSLANLSVQPVNVFTVDSFGELESVEPSEKMLTNTNEIPVGLNSSNIEPNSIESFLIEESTLEQNNENSWFDESSIITKKNINQPHKPFEKESRSEKSLAKIASKKASLIECKENISDDEVMLDSRQNLNSSPQTDDDSDIDLVHSSHINNLTNSDIMKMAFSGDNVAKNFAKEKREVSKQENEKIVENVLPGWGDWSGPGMISKSTKIRTVSSIPGAIEINKRKDAKLKHVIINEKRLKKAAKYLQHKLPHGFDTREQYERTISNPLGLEWNTENYHRQVIQPKVVTKIGTFIAPLKMK